MKYPFLSFRILSFVFIVMVAVLLIRSIINGDTKHIMDYTISLLTGFFIAYKAQKDYRIAKENGGTKHKPFV